MRAISSHTIIPRNITAELLAVDCRDDETLSFDEPSSILR
jgi:hypothetical protein